MYVIIKYLTMGDFRSLFHLDVITSVDIIRRSWMGSNPTGVKRVVTKGDLVYQQYTSGTQTHKKNYYFLNRFTCKNINFRLSFCIAFNE